MANILNQLSDNKGARRTSKRLGRGIGSGKGKTSGKGMKGQKARSGIAIKGFEGGQTPIYRRLPKRGFNNPSAKEFETVNIGAIQGFIDSKKLDGKKTISKQVLLEAGIVKGRKSGIKLLGKGEIKAKIAIEVDFASKSAIAAIEKAGGTVTVSPIKEKAEKPSKSSKNKSQEVA